VINPVCQLQALASQVFGNIPHQAAISKQQAASKNKQQKKQEQQPAAPRSLDKR